MWLPMGTYIHTWDVVIWRSRKMEEIKQQFILAGAACHKSYASHIASDNMWTFMNTDLFDMTFVRDIL